MFTLDDDPIKESSPPSTGFVLDAPETAMDTGFVLDTPETAMDIPETDTSTGFVLDTPETAVDAGFVLDDSKKGFWRKVFENTGKAAALKARIGEVQSPEQYKAVTDFAKEIASSATFAISERIPGLEAPEESDTKFIADFVGTMAPLVGTERAIIAPVVKLVKASGKAGKYIAPFVRITGMGSFGATRKEVTELAKGKELPTASELITEGAEWALLDGILQAAGLGLEFGTAINNIAKDTGMSRKDTLRRFFRSIKNKGFDMFSKPPPADEILDAVEQISNKPPEKIPETVDITPSKPKSEPVKPVEKAIEKPKIESSVDESMPEETLNTLNPTGTVFTEYSPNKRAELKIGKNLTTLDKTIGRNPNEKITIYRGAPKSQKEIVPGDFITTNKQLAKDYAGEGKVLEKEVALVDILDDIKESLSEEYIYRPGLKPVVKPSVPKLIQTTPKELKKQKAYILDAAHEALIDATDMAPKSEPFITIDVPNDGTFQVVNTRKSITEFIKRAKKFPTTKDSKVSPKKPFIPSGRISGDDIEYYNDFKPRKSQLKSSKKIWGYDGEFYTDGHIIIKTKKPPKQLKNADIVSNESIARMRKTLLNKATEPAQLISEFKNPKLDDVLVHVKSEGKDLAYNTKEIDAILTAYPKAEAYTDINESPSALTFKVDNESIAVAMPIRDGGKMALESAAKFEPLSKRSRKASLKPKILPVRIKISTKGKGKALPSKQAIPPPRETESLQPDVKGKEVSAKRSDIIKLFEESFKTPIRIGKFRQKAAGIFKPNYKVVRLKNSNDIEVATHEIGHSLSYKLWEDSKGIVKALRPYMHELKPISRYAPYAEEGFAEFTRMYVTRPDSAKKLAPEFYKFFEKTLNDIAPELIETLLNSRAAYSSYINATPESRVASQIVFMRFRGPITKAKDFLKRHFSVRSLKRDWLDDSYYLKEAVAEGMGIKPVDVEEWKSSLNPYVAFRLLKGVSGKAEVFLEHETFDFKTLEHTGKSLKDVLSPVKTNGDMRRLSHYLVSRRSIEKIKQGFKTGISISDAKAVVKKGFKEFETIALGLDKYQDDLLKYYRDSGMLSNENYLEIKKMNKFFVPFLRIMEGLGTGGRNQKSTGLKRFKGGTGDVLDPIETIIANTHHLTKMADINRVKRKLVALARISKNSMGIDRIPPKMAVTNVTEEEIKRAIKKSVTGLIPDEAVDELDELISSGMSVFRPTLWSSKDNVITVFVNGKPQYYEAPREIVETLNGGIGDYNANILVKILSVPAKILRTGAILNPKFLMKNIVRDTLERLIFRKAPVGEIVDNIQEPVAGLFSAIKKDKLYVDFLKSGGGMSTMQSIDKKISINKSSAIARGFSKFNPVGLLKVAGHLSEQANRLAEFASALEGQPKDRLGMEYAGFAARDISVDFAKVGMLARAINQMVPFWNTTIQGTDKLVRTFASKDKEKIKNFLFRAIVGVSLPTLLTKATTWGDEDIDEIDDITKDTNWIFKIPFSNKIYRIPVPFTTGIVFHGTMSRAIDFILKKDPHAFDGFFDSIKSSVLPEFIPTFSAPILETYANKDFWKQRAIVPKDKVGLISEEQYSVYTSETAKVLGKIMRHMPGVDEYESKLASPAIIEHFIKSWGGGLGQLFLKWSDEGLRIAGIEPEFVKPERSVLSRLGLDAFEIDFPNAGAKSISDFYDNYNRYTKLSLSAKAKKEKGDEEGFYKLKREFGNINFSKFYRPFRKQQQVINNIMRNPDLTPKEKREMKDKLYRNMIVYARNVNKQLEKFKKESADKK